MLPVVLPMVLLGVSSIVTVLIQGLLFGGILALIAVGLSLIFGVTRVLNIAHGDFLFLGGVVTSVLFTRYSVNPFLSIILVMPIFAGVGILFSLLMKKPMSARSPEIVTAASVLVTLGLSNVIEGLGGTITSIYGYPYFTVSRFDTGTLYVGGIALSNLLVLALAIIVGISIGMTLFVYRTNLGTVMRAAMTDREVAVMLGISPFRVSMMTFAIGISLAALAGTVEVMVTNIDASVGLVLTIQALTVIVLGGVGSFYGALLAGFLIGTSVSVTEIVLEAVGQQAGIWNAAVPLVILIIVLIVKPGGLFRR
jgi:branched-chain amino acid transport system permease protein